MKRPFRNDGQSRRVAVILQATNKFSLVRFQEEKMIALQKLECNFKIYPTLCIPQSYY